MEENVVIKEGFSLVEHLLKEQQQLQTPVAEFSLIHESIPAEQVSFDHLIPLSLPEGGQQYAFKVDLDKCTGCKACVTACHNMNGLDVSEAWRDAGKILDNSSLNVSYQQTITTACHHCDDPACLNGCPVMAYEKDPITGIVKHLDDQCIGCQYCILKCPYDVPKFNKKKGIVRKCDMCHNRLIVGEAPACVQACPNEAITISVVNTKDIKLQSEGAFLPGAPEPSYTKPSTQYLSKRNLSEELVAADKYVLKTEEAHFPLVLMLVVTQLSVGFFTFTLLFEYIFKLNYAFNPAIISLVACVLGIGFSTAHLGQPLKAWKAFLGLRTSWMSREIIAFTNYMMFLTFSILFNNLHLPQGLLFLPPTINFIALSFGIISVFCSVMLYVDTRRKLWSLAISSYKFGSSILILGALSFSLFALITELETSYVRIGLIILVPLVLLKLLIELKFLGFAKEKSYSALKKSALISLRIQKKYVKNRFYLALVSGILIPLILLIYPEITNRNSLIIAVLSINLLLLITSELIERFLFFTTVDAPKMPGE